MSKQKEKEDFRSVLYSVDRKGHRKWLYVDIVRGAWRKRRQLLAIFLIGFYLALPFLTINDLPVLRIDIPNRHYIIMGHIFWPQDFVYALLFVLLAVIGTLLMVALCGRVFCGWLCPHNVFLEMVFRPIERLFEGPAHRHRLNDKKEHVEGRFFKKLAKNIIFLIIAGVLANTATALFVGTEDFIAGIIIDPIKHPYAAMFFIVFFFINAFNFMWFREQTCTLVCPYGRLQTAMLDRETLVVSYDAQRGEPRGKKGVAEGDCIDCERCIQVCPTGIDIRNGNQLECIHCAACIDSCNEVMDRLGRAPDLIKYASEASLAGDRLRVLRPRTVLYAIVFVILSCVTVFILMNRSILNIVQLRQKSAPQMTEVDGQRYMQSMVGISFVNKSMAEQTVQIRMRDDIGAEIIAQFNPIVLEPNTYIEQTLYIRVPFSAFSGNKLTSALEFVHNGDVHSSFDYAIRRPQFVDQDAEETKP